VIVVVPPGVLIFVSSLTVDFSEQPTHENVSAEIIKAGIMKRFIGFYFRLAFEMSLSDFHERHRMASRRNPL